MSSLQNRIPYLIAGLILFVLVLSASAEARPMTGSPGADHMTVKQASGNTVR